MRLNRNNQRLKLGLNAVNRLGPGGVFSPSDVPNIYAYYDATDPSTLWQDRAGTIPVTAVGQPVGRIDDLSGNNRHLLSSNDTTRRGLYQEGGGILMDGSDDRYSSAAQSTLSLPLYIGASYKRFEELSGFLFGVVKGADDYFLLEYRNAVLVAAGRTNLKHVTLPVYTKDTPNLSWPHNSEAAIDSLAVDGIVDITVNGSAPYTQVTAWDETHSLASPYVVIGTRLFSAAGQGIFFRGAVVVADPGSDRAKLQDWLAKRSGVVL